MADEMVGVPGLDAASTATYSMGAPIGTRKVTIVAASGMDGTSPLILTKPYECVHLIYQGTYHITHRA